MTHEQIADTILNHLTEANGSNNVRIPKEQLMAEISTTNAKIIREGLTALQGISDAYYKTVDCIKLKCEENKICCNIGIGTYSLTAKIPKVFMTHKPIISYIGSADFKRPFKLTYGTGSLYSSYSPITGNVPTAHYNDGVIRLENVNDEIEYLAIRAVWNNYEDLRMYSCCSDIGEEQFPAPLDAIDLIIKRVVEFYGKTYYRFNPYQPNTQKDTQGLSSK